MFVILGRRKLYTFLPFLFLWFVGAAAAAAVVGAFVGVLVGVLVDIDLACVVVVAYHEEED